MDRLTAHLRGQGKTVGIVAVDPTSPFSGGAILGDRIRMQAHATRRRRVHPLHGHARPPGRPGRRHRRTCSPCCPRPGKDVVLVETVGVGQDEVEIVGAADVSVVVLVPGPGRRGAGAEGRDHGDRRRVRGEQGRPRGRGSVVAEIESMLSLAAHDEPRPAIVKTVATARPGHRRAAGGGGGVPRAGRGLRACWRASGGRTCGRQFEETLQDRLHAPRSRERALAREEARARSWTGWPRASWIPSRAADEVLAEDGAVSRHVH